MVLLTLMNQRPKDEISQETRLLQSKANEEMLDWWFEPQWILDLCYWKDEGPEIKRRTTAKLESDVRRLFRFISKKSGLHFHFTIHIGREGYNPHAHVQARISDPISRFGSEGIMDKELVELRDMLRESWLHIIGPEPDREGSEMALNGTKQVPALVRTADDYIDDYRIKNEMPPALSEEHRLQQRRQFLGARVSNYVHNGHFWSGTKRFHVACPNPKRGRCPHHQDVSMSGEI